MVDPTIRDSFVEKPVLEKPKTYYFLIFRMNIPYPVVRELRIQAGNPGTAVARGFRHLRKAYPKKRLGDLQITVRKI